MQISSKTETLILEHLKTLVASTSCNQGYYNLMDSYVNRSFVEKGKPKPAVTLPVISPQVDTMVAYLSATFLSTSQIFPVTTKFSATEVSDAVNTLFTKYASDFEWRRNIVLCFKDAARYNHMFCECTWQTKNVEQTSAEIAAKLPAKQIAAGFSIKHLSPRTVLYDTTVEMSRISTDGVYAGYTEQLSVIALRRFLRNLPDNSMWAHRIDTIIEVTGNGHGISSFSTILDDRPLPLFGTRTETMEVATLYVRLLSNDFLLRKAKKNSIDTYKIIVVGGLYIVYIALLDNAHDRLPIVCGVPNETSLGTVATSIPEDLIDLQILASNLMSTEFESNKKVVADRKYYDSEVYSKAQIENPNAGACVAKRQHSTKSLTEGVYHVPYNDPALGTRPNLAALIMQQALTITGQNQVMTGQFVRGNKTNAQFNEVLAKSDARQVALAIMLEDQFFSSIKTILLHDFIQYQPPVTIYNYETKSEVSYSPSAIANSDMDFAINDALRADTTMPSPEVVSVLMQTIQANEELAGLYDLAKLFAYYNKILGIKDIDKFLKVANPQQQQVENVPAETITQPNDTGETMDDAQLNQMMTVLDQPNGGVNNESPLT